MPANANEVFATVFRPVGADFRLAFFATRFSSDRFAAVNLSLVVSTLPSAVACVAL